MTRACHGMRACVHAWVRRASVWDTGGGGGRGSHENRNAEKLNTSVARPTAPSCAAPRRPTIAAQELQILGVPLRHRRDTAGIDRSKPRHADPLGCGNRRRNGRT